MTDIVRIFQNYAEANEMIFHYGTKYVTNLLGGSSTTEWTGNPQDIYFLMDSRKGTGVKGELALEYMRWTGNFILCKHSDLDQEFFNEQDGKYQNNIEPLITAFKALFNSFACSDVEVEEMEFNDITDYLDINMDGIAVRYRMKTPIGLDYDRGSTSS